MNGLNQLVFGKAKITIMETRMGGGAPEAGVVASPVTDVLHDFGDKLILITLINRLVS